MTQKQDDSHEFMDENMPTEEFIPQAGGDFVVTPYINDLTERALAYLSIGYAVHLSGPAGTGKSTLAMHIASKLGRPCTLLHGDDEFQASDLLGRDTGYTRNSVVDNYVSSIVKTEETLSVVWKSNRLTTACQKGHTLVYDEFTRSPATANNPFLSILEEGILNIPSSGKEKGYIMVHPAFRAIFTSNPEEYVGVHKTQDALLDRMITLSLDYQDEETETAIVVAKSKRSRSDAEKIVKIVRAVRNILGGQNGPTVRAAIAIARIIDERRCDVDPADPIFCTTCNDVLSYQLSRQGVIDEKRAAFDRIIESLGCGSIEPGVEPVAVESAPEESESTELGSSGADEGATESAEPHETESHETERPLEAEELTPNHLAATATKEAANEERVEQDLLQEATELTEFAQPVLAQSEADEGTTPPVANETPVASEITLREPTNATASPLQMLEAAVSRFPRPPARPTGNSSESRMPTRPPFQRPSVMSNPTSLSSSQVPSSMNPTDLGPGIH